MRYKFVADLSELKSIWADKTPDLFITGGFGIPETRIASLYSAVEACKSKHLGTTAIPVKWNLRDLDRGLGLFKVSDRKSQLIAVGDSLRAELVHLLCAHHAVLFTSILLAYSSRKSVLAEKRSDLIGWGFSNLLQRFGLFARTVECAGGSILLDWPDRNQPTPFVTEYLGAWEKGDGNFCGPLKKLGFDPSPAFGLTDVEPLLQLADLVVGMARALVRNAQNGYPAPDFGSGLVRDNIESFYKDKSGRILGWGIAVSPSTAAVSKQIRDALTRFGCTTA